MAASTKKSTGTRGGTKKVTLIDPLYQKFTKGVVRALGSSDFYEFFMDAVAHAQNEIQFSNRKMIKTVDLAWVDAVEESLEAFQTIISNPRNIIKEEELVVNVAHARKAGPEVVRHLSQHAALVEKFDPDAGEVRPNKVMQRYREDTWGLYENRLVFTAMENAYQFVKIRHDALFSVMSDEFGAKLKVHTEMESATELVRMDSFIHIKEIESPLDADERNHDVFSRISRIYRMLNVFMNSQFAQQMSKLSRVRGTATKTNVLKKNPSYRKILILWDFLRQYDEIGYTIRVVEQNPEVNETLQRDIFHNVLFNYLVLKGYLEDEADRKVPAPAKGKKRTLKPKFIHEIIEELTEDYDLPDVEIRKVLIEELTKAQLMQEEAAERRRLVEEQAQRKKEEQERLRQEKEAEKERIRKEKEAEKERLRQEKEAEEARLRQERMEREMEDRRRSKLLKKEITHFFETLNYRLEDREAERNEKETKTEDFADAVRILEEAEIRKEQQKERERIRREEERERARREKLLAEERVRQAKKEEEERLKIEEEKLRAEQNVKDTASTQIYYEEVLFFVSALEERMALRVQQAREAQMEEERRETERRQRLAARQK